MLLGFVILEGSDDFLQRQTAVNNGLQATAQYRSQKGRVKAVASNDIAETGGMSSSSGSAADERMTSISPVEKPVSVRSTSTSIEPSSPSWPGSDLLCSV